MLPLRFSNLELNTAIASYFKSSTGIRILDKNLPGCASRTLVLLHYRDKIHEALVYNV